MNKAIIGGTGVGSLPNLQGPFQTETAFGVVQTYRFRIEEEEILFYPDMGAVILHRPMPSTIAPKWPPSSRKV